MRKVLVVVLLLAAVMAAMTVMFVNKAVAGVWPPDAPAVVIVTIEGMHYLYGPFSSYKDAQKWASQGCGDGDVGSDAEWAVVPLRTPR